MKAKLIGVLVIIFLAAVGALGWVGYQMFSTGFSAKTEPHALEILMARQIRHLAIPIEQRNVVNPIPFSAEVLKKARAHFADHCASCHANDGSGKTPIGRNVYPKAPDLKLRDTQAMSDGELFWVIHNGIRFTANAGLGRQHPGEGSRQLAPGPFYPSLAADHAGRIGRDESAQTKNAER